MTQETAQVIKPNEMAEETAADVTDDVTEVAIRDNEAALQITKPRITRRHSYGKVMMNDYLDFESIFNQILTSS